MSCYMSGSLLTAQSLIRHIWRFCGRLSSKGLGTVQCSALLALKLLGYRVCAIVCVNPSRRRRDPKGQGGVDTHNRAAKQELHSLHSELPNECSNRADCQNCAAVQISRYS
jgi:hypothetical protein